MSGAESRRVYTLRTTVNGDPVEAEVEPRTSLADFLRQTLGLTGTHVGCEHGVCGACTVLLDGHSVRACLVLAIQVDGARVDTIEGMSEGGTLHPIQRAFIEAHGLQCGFCTPGFLMVVSELLNECPDPNDEQIREALGGQICRCTGYQAILDSVHLAAAKLRAASAPNAAGGE